MSSLLRSVVTIVIVLILLMGTAVAGVTPVCVSKSGVHNWLDASSWVNNTVPNSSIDVQIASGSIMTVNGNGAALSLTFLINGAGATLIIPSGDSLFVFNALTMQHASGTNTNTITLNGKLTTHDNINLNGTSTQITQIVTGPGSILHVGINLGGIGAGANFDMTAGGLIELGGSFITGTFTNNGTFTAGAGTVSYQATGINQTVTNTTYNNLILSGDHSRSITTGSVIVNGALTMKGSASASAPPTYGGSSSLIYNGTSTQTTGAELLSDMQQPVIINNSAGVTLGGSTTFESGLTCTSGNLATSSNTVTLGSGATLTEVNGSEVTGTVIASASLNQNVNNTFNGIGIEIDATGAEPGPVSVTRTTGTFLSGNGNNSITRSFEVVPTVNSGLNATVVMHYFNSELNGSTSGNLQINQTTDAGSTWSVLSGIDDGSGKTITATGVDGFGILTAADATAGLAIHVSAFTANSVANSVHLEWSTVTESNNLGFYVERSSTLNGPFTTVSGLIQGAGTSLEPHSYAYSDLNVTAGTYYYRLRDVSSTGGNGYTPPIKFVVSGVEGVKGLNPVPASFALNQNYPNPFNPATSIEYQLATPSYVHLSVFNALGQEVRMLLDGVEQPGYKTVRLDANNLPSGVYFYRITAQQSDGVHSGIFTDTKAMVLLK